MGQRKQKCVLLLCPGKPDDPGRYAESFFNSIAGKMGLRWRASSKRLVPDSAVNGVGAQAAPAINALTNRGIDAAADGAPRSAQAEVEDLEAADRVVALRPAESLAILQARFPTWVEKVEFWPIEDTAAGRALVEQEIMALVARILGGGDRPSSKPMEAPTPERPRAREPAPKAATVKVGRETAGRRGKGVTTVFDMPLDDSGMKELAATLKQRCGTGGTVKDRRIEIQGDQRERIAAELEKLGYKVKRVGG
jgi:predicted translation initiation factor SUI1